MSATGAMRVRDVVASMRLCCDRCTHSRFVHSDYDACRCLFSECECQGFHRAWLVLTQGSLTGDGQDRAVGQTIEVSPGT